MIDIRNCDCFDLIPTLPEHSIDLCVMDPPYDIGDMPEDAGGTVNTVMNFGRTLQTLHRDNSRLLKSYDIEKMSVLLQKIMKQLNVYFFCNKKQIVKYFDVYVNKLNCKYEILTWHKTNALPTYSNKYLTDTEYCLYFHKGGEVKPRNYEDAKTYFIAPINRENKIYHHPTIKPLEFVERMIRNSSREGDLVADFFLGSGTTALACKNQNRNFVGCEIYKPYYDITMNRITKNTLF